jgi:ferrochelatase
VQALARSIGSGLAALDFEPERLVLSFHGMPRRTLDLGDPYHCHCQKTARLVAEAMGLDRERLVVTFQSRFGPAEWLQPYTEPALIGLARAGISKVAVACPGFSADCLETLEEIAIEARDAFLGAGGSHYAYLSCLNDSEEGIAMLGAMLEGELAGWLPSG